VQFKEGAILMMARSLVNGFHDKTWKKLHIVLFGALTCWKKQQVNRN